MSDDFHTPWLDQAMTHSSWAHEHGGDDNERLEFFGDAILEMLISAELFQCMPKASEGELSKVRAKLVSTQQLAELSRVIGLDQRVKLGKGEEATGGRGRERLLAGLFEAYLAAIYLERGLESAAQIVRTHLVPLFEDAHASYNAKQRIQEWSQQRVGTPPTYVLKDTTGPDHARQFLVELKVGEEVLAEAWGSSKRNASTAAAEMALKRLPVK